jgi:hypothetical protein
MDRKEYEKAILAASNAEQWQAELVADLAVSLGNSLESAIAFAKSTFGEKEEA